MLLKERRSNSGSMNWGNKMKAVKCISVITFILITGNLFSDTEKTRFAVAPFINLTESSELENGGTIASATIQKELSEGKWFELRKSSDLENFIENLALAQAGVGNENQILSAGKQLQIRYLTVGSVAKFGSHYEVDARSVNIDTWGIVHSTGTAAMDLDSACSYINRDVEITLTKENLDEKEKNADKLPVIAVSRFNESNTDAITTGYGATLAEVLNSELGARPTVTAVERTHLKSVIDAKEMELCGVYGAGTDKPFNERGIAYKVDGEIRTFPSSICIRYQVSSTSNGHIVYIGFAEIASVKGIRPVSKRIAREIDDAINNKIGTLQLKTNPPAADISIDGQPYGKSPVTVSLVKGNHAVKAMFPGYETSLTDINLEPARVTDKTIVLSQISTALYDQAVQFEQRKDWKGAIAKYDEFINKYATSDDVNKALYRKGHIMLLYMNNADGSLATFESLVKRYPDAETRAEAYFGIARSYKAMGKEDLLKTTLQILYQKFPDEIATEEARSYFKM